MKYRTLVSSVAILSLLWPTAFALADYSITTTATTGCVETVGYASNNSAFVAQDFKTNSDGTQYLSSMTFSIAASGGSPSDGVVVNIEGNNGSNQPNASSLGTSTAIAAGSMTGTAQDFTVTFSPAISLSATTVYWAKISRTGSFSTINYYCAGGVQPGTTDANNYPFKGLRFADGVSTAWLNADDFTLRLVVPITNTLPSTASKGFGTLTFFGWW